jgi:glutathione S-transferase
MRLHFISRSPYSIDIDHPEATMSPKNPIRLHRFALSGHAHRAQLMLSLLGVPHEIVDVDLARGAQRTPEFLALNPFGQVPVIQDGDTVVADSNAILVYLALTRDPHRRWLPEDPLTQAKVQRWLSAAAGPLAFGPASARVAHLFGRPLNPQSTALAQQLLDGMERHLDGCEWLAAPHPTIADVAMYSYTAHAPEGGISLEPWPRTRAWLERVEALPGFVGMARSPLPSSS